MGASFGVQFEEMVSGLQKRVLPTLILAVGLYFFHRCN